MISVNKLTVVMYHYVRDLKNTRYPEIKGLDTECFKEQIGYLKKNYNFVKIEEVINAFNCGRAELLPKHPVLLTFDDAYADHFNTVFPILEQEKIQGCFYAPVKAVTEHTVLDVNKIHFILASTPKEKIPYLINEIKLLLNQYRDEYGLLTFDEYFNELGIAGRFDSKEVVFIKRLLQVKLEEGLRSRITNILFQSVVGIDEATFSRELYMSKDQIKCMVDCGMHFGSHGYDHYWLNSLSKEKQEFEIKKSIEFIKEVGGDPDNWTICYPYGAHDDKTIELLKENGCKLGLTTRVDLADPSQNNGDLIYKLPRLDTNDIPKDANAPVNKWY